MRTIHFIINGEALPRILPEYKNLLQMIHEKKYGDWFVYEDDMLPRVYGFEGELYMLPTFLIPRIFSL